MADRPIIFSGPMVRALLDGRKTQTRRILKLQPIQFETSEGLAPVGLLHVNGEAVPRVTIGRVITEQKVRYAVGDRLWVREAHQFANSGDGPCVLMRATSSRWSPEWTGPDEGAGPSYDYDRCPGDYSRWAADVESTDTPWRPSIHMPRWASRLTLVVTEVRVERLNTISPADAIAEGIQDLRTPDHSDFGIPGLVNAQHPVRAFWLLEEHINGEGSWLANPWVAAISFTVHRANIDALSMELAA